MSRYLMVLAFICISGLLRAQPAGTGELKKAIYSAPTPEARLAALLAFCDQYESYSPDTLKKYALEATALAAARHDARAALLADHYRAAWLFQVNRLDTALALSNNVLARYTAAYPYDDVYTKLYALKGNILLRTAQMDDLMKLDYDWMRLGEAHRDTFAIARAQLGIGNVKSRLAKYDEALAWYHNALGLMSTPALKRRLNFIYSNVAIVFYHLSKEDSALYYIREGIRYAREDGNLTYVANAYFLYAGLLAEFDHLQAAEENFKAGIAARRQIGDVYFLISDMAQLALFYADTKHPEKGIALLQEALALTRNGDIDFSSLNSIYKSLARNYFVAGDYKNYSEALNKELALSDSLYKKNSAEAMAEIQARYDLQKKENTIIQQRLDLVSKNYQLYGSLALLLLAIVSAAIILVLYRRKQRLRLRLLQEEEQRRSDKAVADAEEAERKRIAADLHDSLGAYAASITSNIDRLQLSGNGEGVSALNELRSNSVEIVSQLSDTIWALKKDALSLTAISDRIKVFVQRLQSSYPQITIDVFEDISTDHILAPSQAFQLFQIMKEAINNALRHSNGTYLAITITGGDAWSVDISDNGTGIGAVTISEGGNGILNMKARARESGWRIEWQKAEEGGTHVRIGPTTN